MASIYLIRHGQASFGSDNYDQLSELGCRQAEVLGEYLKLCDIQFDAVYSGDLSRQRKTAEIATAHMLPAEQHIVDPRFNEIDNDGQVKALLPELVAQDAGLQAIADRAFETHSSKDYQKIIERVFIRWVELGADAPAGLQSWADYSAGTRAALGELMEAQGSGKRVAIFTSGGTIATIAGQVLGLDGPRTYRFYEPVINCSVTHLLYSRGKASLSYFNDHSFLDLLGRQRGESMISYR